MRKFEVLMGMGLIAACGGGGTNTATNTPTTTTTASATSSTTATPSGSTASSALPPGDEHVDPTESAENITMTPLVTKGAKTTFPKSTVGDKECWSKVSLSGDHNKDFTALIASCGTPTGLVEYAKPVTGKLHHKVDKRDTFALKLLGGMCYRYFAVADSGISDLDILIEKPNGALIADDKQTSPVAIVDGDKTWCMDEDADYVFAIQVDGTGKGSYMFGVWVKPKGK
jgi:hypothetical protein